MKQKIFCSIKWKRVFVILRQKIICFQNQMVRRLPFDTILVKIFLMFVFIWSKTVYFTQIKIDKICITVKFTKKNNLQLFTKKNVKQQIFEQKIQDLWFQNWLLGSREQDICFCIFFVWTLKYCIHTWRVL